MPLFGPPNIEKMLNNRDVKGLVKVLKGEANPQLRAEAIQALMQIGDGQAIEPLYEARNDDNPGVRALAAIAQGCFGDPRAAGPLSETLYTGGEISVKLLGQLGGKEAVRDLIGVLGTSRSTAAMKSAAVEALADIGDERAVRPLVNELITSRGPERAKLIQAVTRFGDAAVEALVARLTEGTGSPNPRWDLSRGWYEDALLAMGVPAREALLAAMEETRQFDLFHVLVSILEKMDGGLDSAKAKAAYAIVHAKGGQIPGLGPEAEGILSNLLRGDAKNTLWFESLIKIWGADAVEHLIEMVRDDEYLSYKNEAVQALSETGDERAVPCLAAVLQEKYSNKKPVVEALRKFHTPEAIAAVEGLLDLDQRDEVRLAAADALDGWNWTPRNDRAGAVYYATRGEWDRFAALDEAVTTPMVEKILEGARDLETIEILEHIPDPRAVDKLIACLEVYDEKVRLAACLALGSKGDPRAVPALEKVAAYDVHFSGSSGESSNPWAYDDTGGSDRYWSEKETVTYPVREAAQRALSMIKEKAA